MAGDTAGDFIKRLEIAAESVRDELERSKKYRAGIAGLAQKAAESGDLTYIEAAVRFTERIIDGHDRSKAYVDIVRAAARVAINTSDADMVSRALELSVNAETGHDRSHALEAVVTATAEVGVQNNDPAAVEESKRLTENIEYDTYRSSAWRGIARALYGIDDYKAALECAAIALDIIDGTLRKAGDIYRASAYVDLSKLFMDLGEEDLSRQCITKAGNAAEGLTDEFERSSVYQSIAETLVRMGARIKDRTLFEDAVKSFGNISREYYRTSAGQTLRTVLANFNEDQLLEKTD